MASSIATEWGEPCEQQALADPPNDRYIAIPSFGSDELVRKLGEPLRNAGLRLAFLATFQHDWCRADPYRMSGADRLYFSWQAFARHTKEEARYLFLRTGRSKGPYSELVEPAAMLDELGVSIVNSGLIGRLPAGSVLFRARQHRLEETLATAAELGSPPQAHAGANRLSPAGIPAFYGAEDVDTALAELHLEAYPRRATVAAWTTAREMAYLDLVDVEIPSLFDMAGRAQRPWLLFLRRFAEEAAQPVSTDSVGIDYVPTQIVTEFVCHELLDSDGSPLRGIRYCSAARPGGVSWVLLVDARSCVEAAPGWEEDPAHWLAMEPSWLRHFRPAWAEEPR